MTQKFNLTINKPCAEKFEDFQPTTTGGFCDSCEKEVIDFTKMSEEQVAQFFAINEKKVCGRFRETQLKTYSISTPSKKTQNFKSLSKSAVGFSLLALLSLNSQEVMAQYNEQSMTMEVSQKEDTKKPITESVVHNGEYVVQGVVLDEEGLTLPFAPVVLKNSTIATITDIDGQFKFPKTLKVGDVLVFSYIGYETQEFVVYKNASAIIDVEIVFRHYDLMIMGEVITDEVYASKPSFWQKVKGAFK